MARRTMTVWHDPGMSKPVVETITYVVIAIFAVIFILSLYEGLL